MIRLRTLSRATALAGATMLALSGLSAPAQAALPTGERGPACFDPAAAGAGSAAARGGAEFGKRDHREITPAQQRAIEARTAKILKAGKGKPGNGGTTVAAAGNIPVYVHVMADANGNGDVTDTQIAQQIQVLNKTYGGQESGSASMNTVSISSTTWPAASPRRLATVRSAAGAVAWSGPAWPVALTVVLRRCAPGSGARGG